ncbi:Aspartate aminotransferase [Clostridiaceae bacterium JG1575]|nr:Aspartate aminotransferase [Clostridiaceae bacterium JG1575]
MKLSQRIQAMQFSPIRKLAPYAAAARAQGVTVYPLNIGQPDIETPETFKNALSSFHEKVLAYSDSRGLDVLLEAYRSYYKGWGMDFEKEDLIVTNAGSEALTFAMTAICDPGDEIIVPEPFYTNYNSFAALAQAHLKPLTTKAEDGFHLPSKEAVEALITERTKGILISNPGNPTGVVYTEEEIRMLTAICLEHDLTFIVDEVYREFTYDGLKFFSPFQIPEALEHLILIDSVSKRYSACGARIGLIASKNKELMQQVMKLAQARLCVPTVDQIASAELFSTDPSYLEKVNKEYAERRDILYAALKEIPGVICEKPTGAFYIVVKLPIANAEEFAQWMLTDFRYENQTVLVAPCAGFYATKGLGQDEIRLSYCIQKAALQKAAQVLRHGVEEYQRLH